MVRRFALVRFIISIDKQTNTSYLEEHSFWMATLGTVNTFGTRKCWIGSHILQNLSSLSCCMMHHVSIHTVVVSNFLYPFKVQTRHHHHTSKTLNRRRNQIVLDDRSYGKRRVRSTVSCLPWDTVYCCCRNAQKKTKIKGKWSKWGTDSPDFWWCNNETEIERNKEIDSSTYHSRQNFIVLIFTACVFLSPFLRWSTDSSNFVL